MHGYARRMAFWLAGCAAVGLAGSAAASSGGISGKTGRVADCTQCHSPGVAPPTAEVELNGGAASVRAGADAAIVVRMLRNGASTNPYAGFNAEILHGNVGLEPLAGSLGAGTRLIGTDEVTHQSRQSVDPLGEAEWSFAVAAPVQTGGTPLTVYAAVNNTNGGGTGGDEVGTVVETFTVDAWACGDVGAPAAVCDPATFDAARHALDQDTPCCCPDSDADGYLAAFCHGDAARGGGDCADDAAAVSPEASEDTIATRCNLVDDDCDGIVDNIVQDEVGVVCSSNADCPADMVCNRTSGVGRCAASCPTTPGGEDDASYSCNFVGELLCRELNIDETCDGADQDRDGLIDEDFKVGPGALGTACVATVGACALPGQYECRADGAGTECVATDPTCPDAGPVDAGEPDAGALVDAGEPDAGAPVDAGEPADAGVPDAGAPVDAGVPDAGAPVDAGEPDAGAPVDAGLPDAGAPDAGLAMDAGTPDAGAAVDAGAEDAGLAMDAGAGDAGAPVDAGTQDAGVAAIDAGGGVLLEPVPGGCQSTRVQISWAALALGLLGLRRRRRSKRADA